MGQHAVGELARHDFDAGGTVVQGRDQRKDGRTGVGGPVHVADVNLVERGFADAQHERALLLDTDVGSALDQLRGDAVSDAGESSDAAREDNHSVGGIGTAGHVSADVSIGLLVDLARGLAQVVSQNLADEVATPAKGELLGHDPQGAVGGNEINHFYSWVTFHGEQELAQKKGAAGAGSGDSEVLRRLVGQVGSNEASR